MKIVKALGLGAVSYLVFSIGFNGAMAQSTPDKSQSPPAIANTTTLSPIVVQSAHPRRAKKRIAQSSPRQRAAASAQANRGRGVGQTTSPAAGAGHGAPETAWGHVDGYVATRSGTATKTDASLIETPASVSVVTQDQVQAQAAQTIPQALRYTAGVRSEVAGADNRFDYVYVRGFQADLYLDGMRLFTTGFTSQTIEPFNLERIEVLHGPASIVYGQGNPGGVVDMVSKRPTEDPYHEFFISTGSYGRIQSGIDLSGPLDQNKEWLYRITASGFDVGSQVDHVDYQRISVAPAVTWRPDSDTTITVLGTYQNDPKAGFYNQLPRNGVGTLFPLPGGAFIPTSLYPGEPDLDRMSRETGQVGYLAEHRFDNIWTVRQNLRYTTIDSDITTVFPGGAATGNNLSRTAFFENDKLSTFTLDNQAEAKFATGPFLHTALFGIDYQTGNFSYVSGGSPAGATYPLNVINPIYGTVIPLPPSARRSQDFDQIGFYTQDQIKYDHWVALLGIRWDHADTNTHDTTLAGAPTSNISRTDEKPSKRAALLYKFDNGIAPYIQYTESFQPNATTVGVSKQPFVPTTGRQEEIGIKYQPDPKSLYSVAWFNLTEQNVLFPDPTNPGFSIQGSNEVRSRGVEFEAKTEVNRNLSLLASYTYLDQVVTKSNTRFVPVGRKPTGMPENMATLWADYTFRGGQLDGFGVAGGFRYYGDTTGNLSNIFMPFGVLKVPAVTLFDAAVHYDFSALGPQFKGYSLQVNASNLFDKNYVALCQDTGCYYGLRRQVIATLRYKW